ncbi:FAD:protein FMN transferase, partial [Burkholderia mallei]|nr:FAD:protein FMN transferase [Burkholderia mallei]
SDGASKPPFIAGRAAMPLARRLGVQAVLIVDAQGRVWATDAMAARARFADPALRAARLD